jgi:hypothetical protein
VTPFDYDFVRKLVKERSGLVLAPDKQYLVESRLLPVARKAGLTNLSDVVQRLKRPDSQAFVTEVVEAMMTNESCFLPRQDSVRAISRHHRSVVDGGPRQPTPHSDLVRGLLDRSGAVLTRDVRERAGSVDGRLAGRHSRH